MRKKIIKFLSFFIPNKQKRKAFRKKCNSSYTYFSLKKYKISGKNNKVIVVIDGREIILSKYWKIKGLDINIKGNNNTIKVEFPIAVLENNVFQINGNNNLISLKKTQYPIYNFSIGSVFGENRSILIGEDFSVARCRLWLEDNNSSVVIGNDCMLSHDLFFRQSDGHCIIDENGNIRNRATEMIIGDHVWIGAWVRLCKNVQIPDGCIIGMGSVVTKKFTQKNAVIAGNPAKIVKENVHWIHDSINAYSERRKNESSDYR